MQKQSSPSRFVESIWGRVAAWVLLLIWMASMGMPDDLGYTQLPMILGLILVVALALLGLMRGHRVVQLPTLAWLSLGAACYIALRALTSYSVLEGYIDLGLLLGCVVFYLTGIHLAQVKHVGCLLAKILCAALILNIIYWLLMNKTEVGLWVVGRLDVGLAGVSTRHEALFLYKNFAGAFLLFGGAALCWYTVWARRWGALIYPAVGIVSMLLSFYCETRAVFLLIPLVLVVGWLLWLILRLFDHKRVRWYDALMLLAIVVGVGIGIYDLLFGSSLTNALGGIDTHLRYDMWNLLLQILPEAPLWGYGAGASQWEIVFLFNDWARPNYAHNEYLQMWADYGLIGLGLLLILLVSHFFMGMVTLGNEEASSERKLAVALCGFVLICLCLLSLSDFVWHQYALASLSAFCCGILGSPARRKGTFWQWLGLGRKWSSTSVHPLRAQGVRGRIALAVIMIGCTLLLALLVKIFAPVYYLQYKWNSQLAIRDGGRTAAQTYHQAASLYPDYRIIERLARFAAIKPALRTEQIVALLESSLAHNPKNPFALTHLVELYGYLGHFEKAERVMRQHLPAGGPPPNLITQPHVHYGLNVLYQGFRALSNGEAGKAYSMLDYGLKLHKKRSLTLNMAYIADAPMQNQGFARPGLKELLATATRERDFLQSIGVEKDDAWQAPERAGEQGALYRAYAAD